MPLLNIWMKRLYCLFLKRDDMKASLKTILQATEYVKQAFPSAFSPEGTRGDSDEMAPFKEGSLKIAEKAGCPIIPMAITHTRDIIKDHIPFVKPTHVTIQYGTPVYPNELPKEEKRALGRYTQNISGNAGPWKKPEAYKLPALFYLIPPRLYKLPPLPWKIP